MEIITQVTIKLPDAPTFTAIDNNSKKILFALVNNSTYKFLVVKDKEYDLFGDYTQVEFDNRCNEILKTMLPENYLTRPQEEKKDSLDDCTQIAFRNPLPLPDDFKS